jgi:hypothetical protein
MGVIDGRAPLVEAPDDEKGTKRPLMFLNP